MTVSDGRRPTPLLDRCDAYLDAAPRSATEAVALGSFVLFVPTTTQPWPYYARPARDRSHPPTADEVRTVIAEQDRRGLPRTFEWVHELEPSLAGTLRAAGLSVSLQPLLVASDRSAASSGSAHEPASVPPPRIRRLAAEDPAVPASAAVAAVAFGSAGTRRGAAGPAERDTLLAERASDADNHVRSRITRGLTVVVVAETEDGVVGVGSHQPIGDATEIVGVATLPTHRRRGIAAAVTSALLAYAREAGIDLVLLSAAGPDVARVYERIGFVQIGHAGAADR